MATTLEYALLAGVSYRSTRTEINRFPAPTEWSEIPNSHQNLNDSGFEAISFQRGTDIIISYAGTYDKDITGDIFADIGLATGIGSAQLCKLPNTTCRSRPTIPLRQASPSLVTV